LFRETAERVEQRNWTAPTFLDSFMLPNFSFGLQ
jgi:hypothetical protein